MRTPERKRGEGLVGWKQKKNQLHHAIVGQEITVKLFRALFSLLLIEKRGDEEDRTAELKKQHHTHTHTSEPEGTRLRFYSARLPGGRLSGRIHVRP